MDRNRGDCKDALAHVGGGSIGSDLAHTELYVTQRTTWSGPPATPVQHMEVYQPTQRTLIKCWGVFVAWVYSLASKSHVYICRHSAQFVY